MAPSDLVMNNSSPTTHLQQFFPDQSQGKCKFIYPCGWANAVITPGCNIAPRTIRHPDEKGMTVAMETHLLPEKPGTTVVMLPLLLGRKKWDTTVTSHPLGKEGVLIVTVTIHPLEKGGVGVIVIVTSHLPGGELQGGTALMPRLRVIKRWERSKKNQQVWPLTQLNFNLFAFSFEQVKLPLTLTSR